MPPFAVPSARQHHPVTSTCRGTLRLARPFCPFVARARAAPRHTAGLALHTRLPFRSATARSCSASLPAVTTTRRSHCRASACIRKATAAGRRPPRRAPPARHQRARPQLSAGGGGAKVSARPGHALASAGARAATCRSRCSCRCRTLSPPVPSTRCAGGRVQRAVGHRQLHAQDLFPARDGALPGADPLRLTRLRSPSTSSVVAPRPLGADQRLLSPPTSSVSPRRNALGTRPANVLRCWSGSVGIAGRGCAAGAPRPPGAARLTGVARSGSSSRGAGPPTPSIARVRHRVGATGACFRSSAAFSSSTSGGAAAASQERHPPATTPARR